MRRLSYIVLCTALLLISAAHAAPVPPKIAAESAILVDAATGKVLYTKNCRQRRPIASTTKIMTAALALETCEPDEVCQASERACSTPFASLNLKPGETMTLHDLLYATLLRSANDGAVCVAEHVAGSEEEFVQAMNRKAEEIGAADTHFANPHGLYAPGHYSTAYDLALIARYAMRQPDFNEIVRSRTRRLSRSINTKDEYAINTAKILWKYEGADGVKTGYTREAGHCFVGSATRDGWRLISVVLKSPNCGKDTMALLDYGFKHFRGVCFVKPNSVVRSVPVAGGVKEELDLLGADWLGVVTRRGDPAKAESEVRLDRAVAPIEKGQKLGTVTGYLNGEKIGAVDLVAAESVGRTAAATVAAWLKSMLIVFSMLLVGIVTYGTAFAKAARRRRCGLSKRRRKTYRRGPGLR